MNNATPSLSRVSEVALPAESVLTGLYPSPDLADAFAVGLPAGTSCDPETLARYVLENQPAWVNQLMKVRDALVRGLGLKTAKQLRVLGSHPGGARVGIFRIYEIRPNEIILGEDDSHLDFRVSVLCQPLSGDAADTRGASRVVVSTVVDCHNLLGRSYIRLIAPFHRQVVQAGLRRAVRAGWLPAKAP